MSKKLRSAVAAACGGVSPTLFGVGAALLTGSRQLSDFPVDFIVGLIIFAAIGGAVGYYWNEESGKKAFQLGIALPALLQVGLSSLTPAPSNPGSSDGEDIAILRPFTVQPVYAKSPPSENRRDRRIKVVPAPGSEAPEKLSLVFLGKGSEGVAVEIGQEVPVPDWARQVQMELGSVRSDRQPLSQNHDLTLLVIKVERTSWFGFLYSIGVRSVQPYTVEVDTVFGQEFISAVDDDDRETVKQMLELGMPVDTRQSSDDRETALILAAGNGYAEIVRILLAAGADINAIDKDRETALIDASKHGHLEVVQYLLGHEVKPDLTMRDNDHETAMQKAINGKHPRVAEALKGAWRNRED